MQHTLVAVFDNRSDAQQAMDELLASSFSSTNVRLSHADPTGHTDSQTGAATLQSSSHDDESIGTSIKNFFSDIFGSDDSVNAQHYESAVTRGHHVLTIGPVSEPEVERAADIVERFGPIDIDEDSTNDLQGTAAGGLGSDQIMRRDSVSTSTSASASQQGSQSLSFQNDDRQPFQQGNLNDPVPMGGTYQEPSGGNSNLSHPGGQPLSSSTAGMSMQDGTQGGAFQRNDLGSSGGISGGSGMNSGSGIGSNVGSSAAGTTAAQETRRPGMRVFPRDAGDLNDTDRANRNHWSSTYGQDGGTYDDYAPAYSYGSSLASDEKFRGRSWDDAESDIRSDWESRNAGSTSTWDKMKAAVRHGWERITS